MTWKRRIEPDKIGRDISHFLYADERNETMPPELRHVCLNKPGMMSTCMIGYDQKSGSGAAVTKEEDGLVFAGSEQHHCPCSTKIETVVETSKTITA